MTAPSPGEAAGIDERGIEHQIWPYSLMCVECEGLDETTYLATDHCRTARTTTDLYVGCFATGTSYSPSTQPCGERSAVSCQESDRCIGIYSETADAYSFSSCIDEPQALR